MTLRLRGAWADGDGAKQEERPVKKDLMDSRHDDWSKVHADQEYALNINLKRLNRAKVREFLCFLISFL